MNSKHALALRLLACGLALSGWTACGGRALSPAPRARLARAAPGQPCPPELAILGGECWSAEGTEWQIAAAGPGGPYAFQVTLLAAGRARVTDHPSAGPAGDEWAQDGDVLRIFLADRFVEYRAQITNGTVLLGEARSVRGQRWSWRAERVFREIDCAPHEARLDRSCFDAAGTRWWISSEGRERLITLLGEGRVLTSGPEPSQEDRWEQQGSRLVVRLGESELACDITSPDELAGTARAQGGREWLWSATRVETLAPPYRP